MSQRTLFYPYLKYRHLYNFLLTHTRHFVPYFVCTSLDINNNNKCVFFRADVDVIQQKYHIIRD